MEESLKSLNTGAKVLAHRSNTMWGILLVTEEVAKTLAVNLLTIKSLRFLNEYMDTRKTRITLHGLSMYITDDHIGGLLCRLWTSSLKSKMGIATSDFEVMVTLTRQKFIEIPNVLTCGG